MAGRTLGNARLNKNDEFYTNLADIENELKHYKKHFAGKTIFCNCDDPFESNFFRYFVLNFNRLGLKKLIATCYTGSPIAGQQLSLFDIIGESPNTYNKPYKAVVTQVYDKTGDGGIDMLDVAELFKSGENTLELLESDGDFRSTECLELLKEADIVVTNPPFSLFREYINTLQEYNKKFIIIGNQNAITYKEVFPLLMTNQIWLGSQKGCISLYFEVPDSYEVPESARKVCVSRFGEEYCKTHHMTYMRTACWFTNLDIKKRHEEKILVKKYSAEEYPHYENYDAINVNKSEDIPINYKGTMGVPITFLYQHCPEQFDLLGFGAGELGVIAGVKPYDRALKPLSSALRDGIPYLYDKEKNEVTVPYARIFIRYTSEWIASHPYDFKED